MALPSHFYGDPCEVLERKQEHELKKLCTGCIHIFKVEFKSDVEYSCNKGKRYGRRCKFYEPGNDDKMKNGAQILGK